MKSPVALIIFNRPLLTQRVLDVIREYQPEQLFVIADGPRTADDAGRCAAARSVIDRVDWDCAVHRQYSDTNLGCQERVSSGLDWVFEQCEEAIVLEDDCVPDPSFFPYCAQLLEHYRNDERIMAISGGNFQLGQTHMPYSYYFSRFYHVWGWSTWRSAWQRYDSSMTHWPELRVTSWLLDILGDTVTAGQWRTIFDHVYADQVNSWAYRWVFSCWAQNSLAIVPSTNLVSNIGFGVDATNTTGGTHPFASLPVTGITFPLAHPPYVMRDRDADQFEYKLEYPISQTNVRRLLRQKSIAIFSASIRKPMRQLLATWNG